MKVHLIKKQSIDTYVQSNAQSKLPFTIWLLIIKHADWNIPNDIIATYNTADILGNKYRMFCHYVFGNVKIHLFVNWIGTHAAYTKLCKQGKQYTVSVY